MRRILGGRARRAAVLVWLAGMLAAAFVTVRARYVADLSAFLPSTPSAEQAVLLDQLRSGVASRLVLIGIEGGSAAARSAASLDWADALRRSGLFVAVDNGDRRQYEAFGKFLFDHRYLLSPAVDADRFSIDGLRNAIDDTLSLLGTPAGTMLEPILLRDPTGETLRMAESMLPAGAPRSEGGVWVSRTAPRAVMVATTRADGADLDGQQTALDLVRSSFAPYAAEGLRLQVSGAGTFAVDSRARIQHEVERLAAAGSVAIVLLLLLAFGSMRSLAIALLPVASGVLAGIAVVSLAFGHVHGITLGFGTTLIGEAVDYAIYYLIQAHRPAVDMRSASGAERWLRHSWPTVRLGLWTSICGFAALLFSGFPGLMQLGVFSMAGLCAAALTTRHVFPVIAPDGAPGVGLRRRLGRLAGRIAALLPALRWPLAALSLAALVMLAWGPSPWRGDLASLSPVGASAMALDAELRRDLGTSEGGLLIAVSAADEADVLARSESVGQRLDALIAKGVLQGYDSPARLLPSLATQAARRAALPEAEALRARLDKATADGALPAARLGPFVDDVQAARRQPLLDRAGLHGTPLSTLLDAMLIPGGEGQPWRALINLHAAGEGGFDSARLKSALTGLPGVQVVDIGSELAALYARYLREAGVQALLGSLAVVLVLALHLRSLRRLVRVAQPIAAAVVVVMAALSISGAVLGILHLVGFLLVVAIGSNYALFFDSLRQAGGADGDTLASLALANLTAAVSFGLLALSSIPTLHAIGIVVAPGVLMSLLLAAAFNPRQRCDKPSYGKLDECR